MKKTISKDSAVVSLLSLVNESDKGCILIIASVLEEMLRQLHEAHIAANTHATKDKKIDKKLFESLSRSTFSQRIEMGYAYGLISKNDYEDAEIIRGLRNEAAHTILDFRLTDRGIQSEVMKLKAASREKQSALFLAPGLPKDLSPSKHHLILNGLALSELIRLKIVSALERYMDKRGVKTASHHHG